MKRILYFLLVPVLSFAQQLNYTKTTTYKVPTTTSIPNPSANDALQIMQYGDGFGRPIQKIFHQHSNLGNDMVLPIEYDAMGREAKMNLHYANSAPSLNYIPTAVADQANYPEYLGQYPYSETVYEKSSLGRVLQQSAPGADWTSGSGHEIKFEYKNNLDSDSVKLFIATATWEDSKGLYDITLTQNTNYAANTLFKRITKNENWVSGTDNTVEEYTDKSGRFLLKRMYNGNEIHDTYYVYDQFGNLTYVIPPKADMAVTGTILDKLCYQYKYDDRNRLVEKKMPGKQWEYIIYDKLDRVVAVGPTLPPFSNLTASGWTMTKYDNFSRPILTAWVSAGSSNFTTSYRKTQQDLRYAETVMSESRTPTTPDVTISGITYRYTNLAYPRSAYHVLTVNYYDDYTYTDAPTVPTSITSTGENVYYNNTILPKGLSTGKFIRICKASNTYRNNLNYTFYDKKARPIREFLRNHELGTGGYTQTDTKFNFFGQMEYTVKLHKRINSDPGITIKDSYTYSSQNYLLTHTHQINGGAIELLAENTYDELGKLISKKTGNTLSSPLQNINYNYNIRGWLTDINSVDNLVQSGDPNDLFAYRINFNTVIPDLLSPTIAKQYDGNISETYWRTANDNILRKYAYKYDALKRFRHSFYRLPHMPQPTVKSYDEDATYDKNGNITFLSRNGDNDGGTPVIEIDDLAFTYETDSNRLLRVTEATPTQTSGFRDGVNTNDDYEYDANGNLTKDENKGLVNGSSKAIIYNHLNLPTKLIFGTTATIEYNYDAEGNKIEKIFTQGSTVTTTKYLNGFQYVNDVLQFIPTKEGYAIKVGSTYKYVFQYKDHLGNVRLSYAKDSNGNNEIIEESNYYPFGLKHSGYNNTTVTNAYSEAQKYKFQGQERQEELGLNWDSFKWRNYDPAIGRFMSVDPLTARYSSWSPYAFSGNRIIDSRELEGLEPYKLFDSQREAALNFVQNYNGISIILNREFGTNIYTVQNTNGTTSYAYMTPTAGEEDYIYMDDLLPVPRGSKRTAYAHTHSRNSKKHENNKFSGVRGSIEMIDGKGNDIRSAEIFNIDAYLGTPNANFFEYNVETNEIIELDNEGIPGEYEGTPTPEENEYDYFDSRDTEIYEGTKSSNRNTGETTHKAGQPAANGYYKEVLKRHNVVPKSTDTTLPTYGTSGGDADGDDGDDYD